MEVNRGSILLVTLVLIVMFGTIFAGLVGFVGRGYHESTVQIHDEAAFQVAEAGLNYARWRLAHDPDDFETETRVLTDQFAGDLGEFEVTFEEPIPGSTIVNITSVGTVDSFPTREVTLRARYGRPSLARFASITDGDVWYGGGTISGSVHANGGIRTDSPIDSIMSSARETYQCQPYHGCNSPSETKPGIWGNSPDSDLWEFPVPVVDYAGLTQDLLDIKTAAQGLGTYYGPSGAHGYEIVFNSDNTYTIRRVTSKSWYIWSYWTEAGWQYTSHDVGGTELIGTYDVPSNGVIFTEDTLWVSGDIRDRVTVAAGVFPDISSTNVDVILNGSITYDVTDGTRAFAAIGQRDVLIPYAGADDVMTLHGAFVAQKGSFLRRYYSYGSHVLKTSLTRYGMLASDGVPATSWVDGLGQVVSGFQSGSSSYDASFLYGPPPYFPTSGEYEFISWQQD